MLWCRLFLCSQRLWNRRLGKWALLPELPESIAPSRISPLGRTRARASKYALYPPKLRLSALLTSIDQMVHLVLWSTGWTQELFCFKFCLWFSGWNCHVLLLSRFCVWARRRRATEKIPHAREAGHIQLTRIRTKEPTSSSGGVSPS